MASHFASPFFLNERIADAFQSLTGAIRGPSAADKANDARAAWLDQKTSDLRGYADARNNFGGVVDAFDFSMPEGVQNALSSLLMNRIQGGGDGSKIGAIFNSLVQNTPGTSEDARFRAFAGAGKAVPRGNAISLEGHDRLNRNYYAASAVENDAGIAGRFARNAADNARAVTTNIANNIRAVTTNTADNARAVTTNSADIVGLFKRNAADNIRAVTTNTADNIRAVATNSADNVGKAERSIVSLAAKAARHAASVAGLGARQTESLAAEAVRHAASIVGEGERDTAKIIAEATRYAASIVGLGERHAFSLSAEATRHAASIVGLGERHNLSLAAEGERNDASIAGSFATNAADNAAAHELAVLGLNNPNLAPGHVQYLAPEFQPIPTVPVPGEALLPGPRADIPPANTVASVYAAAPMTPSQKRSGAGPKRHEFHDRRTGEIVLMTVEEGAENPRRYVDPGNVLFLHDTKTGMVVEGVKELIKQQFPGDEDEIEPAVFEVVAELAEAYLRRTDMTSQQAVRKAVSDLKEGGVFSDPGYLTTNEIGIDPKWVPRLSKLFEQWAEQTARNFSKAGGQ